MSNVAPEGVSWVPLGEEDHYFCREAIQAGVEARQSVWRIGREWCSISGTDALSIESLLGYRGLDPSCLCHQASDALKWQAPRLGSSIR